MKESLAKLFNIGIVYLNNELRVIYLNDTAAELLDINKNETIGRSQADIGWREGSKGAYEFRLFCETVLKEKKVLSERELTVFKHDESVGHIFASGSPFLNENNEITGAVFSLIDLDLRNHLLEMISDNETKLKALIKTPSSVVIFLSPEGDIIEFNDQAEKLYGVKKENVFGKNYFDLFLPPEAREPVYADLKKVLSGEPTSGFINDVITPEGIRTMEWHVHRYVDDHDLPLGSIAVGYDVTYRIRTEERLKESEEKYRRLIDSAYDAIFVADCDSGVLIDANKAAEKLIGRPLEKIIGMHQSKLHPAEEATYYRQLFGEAVNKGTGVFYDLFVSDVRGKLIPVDVSVNVVELGGKKLIQGVFRDMSDYKKSERALKKSEERYRTLAETAQDDIFIIDKELKFTYANSHFLAKFNLSLDDVEGKRIDILFPASSNYKNKIIEVFESGKSISTEEKYMLNGREVWFDIRFSPIQDESGQVFAIMGISRDITDRIIAKTLSDALNDINAAISSSLNLDKIMQKGVSEANRAMGSESTWIFLRSGNQWLAKYREGVRVGNLYHTKFNRDELPIVTMAAETKKAITVFDTSKISKKYSDILKKSKIKSALAVPLIVKKEVIGVLSFYYHSASECFSQTHIDFANKLSVSMSLAIENARLYSEERHIADTLQESQLILPSEIEKIEFGHIYRSATEEAQVGGDFYDIIELEHDQVGFVIGDVSGKGLQAANLTSLVKNTIRAYCYENHSTAAVMAKTNDAVIKNTDYLTFVTVFLGVLDKKTGRFRYCDAGHPPGLVKKRNKKLLTLRANSPAIGIFPDQEFFEDRLALRAGDMLFLYTDGLIEARRKNIFFGEKRLEDFVKYADIKEAEILARFVYDKVIEYTEDKLLDDLAILSISYHPEKEFRLVA